MILKKLTDKFSDTSIDNLTPPALVEALDQYIIGQKEAKKMVSIAIRNRWRRKQLGKDMKQEVMPKNIILMGPTGVGKTEISRRLSMLVRAPFLKVEASKFTEVGYHGRDVESMVRDLTDISVNMIKEEKREQVQDEAKTQARERVLDLLLPEPNTDAMDEEERERRMDRYRRNREKMQEKLNDGTLDDRYVEVEVEESSTGMMQVFSQAGFEEYGMDLGNMMGDLVPSQKETKKVKVPRAVEILADQEAEKLIDQEEVKEEGLERVQESGILFIDEIDKISEREDSGSKPDVSREGVQRDLLPLIEGTTVNTRYGTIKTDHILFIGAGAFHGTSPSDMIPELQGRFPLRAELDSLEEEDFVRILTEPRNALIKQYKALLDTEDVQLEFREDAIQEMASISAEINESTQDIGARRLHTVIENVVQECSFHAREYEGKTFVIDQEYVREQLDELLKDEDLQKYIL